MKKIFITLALILVSCTTCAQVYNFNYDFNGKDVHLCTTKDDNCLYMKGLFQIFSYNFTLRAVDAKTSLDLLFDLSELIKLLEESGKSRVADKECFIQIELSNGDMLRSNTQNAILGDRLVFISSGSITVNNKKLNDNGYYVMSLLRTYDIVNFTIDGASIKAPEIHTADTFDAMCKTLIAKAGDKGQYGKRLTGDNNATVPTQITQVAPTYVTKRIAKPNIKTVVTNANGAKMTKAILDFQPNQVFNGDNVITCNLNIEFIGEYGHDYRPFVFLYKDNKGTPLAINGRQVYSSSDQMSYYKKDGSFKYYGFGHSIASLPIYYKELDSNINTFYARLWMYDETDKKYIGCSDYYSFTRNGNISVVPSKNNSNNESSTQKNKTSSSNNTSKPSTKTVSNTSKNSIPTKSDNVDLNKANATTLKKEAENGNIEAMYILGCRYHDGQLSGIEKNDRKSFEWLLKSHIASDQGKGNKGLEEIKRNLQKKKTSPSASHDYVGQLNSLKPIDIILHPLATFSTTSFNMNESFLEKEIVKQKKWNIEKSIKKKYDKNKIVIREQDNNNNLPTVLGTSIERMEWRYANRNHVNYEYDFDFSNKNEAENFIYDFAYDSMMDGLNYKKSLDWKKTLAETGLVSSNKMFINGKLYSFDVRIQLIHLKANNHYHAFVGITIIK